MARKLSFARADDAGLVSEGFDLDGVDAQCGVADFTDPEGATSVDNALAKLLPVLEQTEAAVIEPLIQDSVNGGAMLLMFDLTDLDALADDACVEVDVFKGLGIPMVGYDGWILPYQTFEVNPDTPVTAAPTAALIDGRLEVGPIETVDLKITVLDLQATVRLHDVRLRLEPLPDGTWTGLIAGGVLVEDIVEVATLQNVDDAVFELIGPVLDLLADLAPDETGTCTQISMTLQLEAVPAFVFR